MSGNGEQNYLGEKVQSEAASNQCKDMEGSETTVFQKPGSDHCTLFPSCWHPLGHQVLDFLLPHHLSNLPASLHLHHLHYYSSFGIIPISLLTTLLTAFRINANPWAGTPAPPRGSGPGLLVTCPSQTEPAASAPRVEHPLPSPLHHPPICSLGSPSSAQGKPLALPTCPQGRALLPVGLGIIAVSWAPIVLHAFLYFRPTHRMHSVPFALLSQAVGI